MEPDAAPAAGDERSSRTREAPGPDRAALRPLRREPAGLGPFHLSFGQTKARQADEANWRYGLRAKQPGRKPGNADPGIRNRRMARREAPAFLATGTRQDGRLVRRSVRHPLIF